MDMALLVLQHPQEKKRTESTASQLVELHPNSKLLQGLSWPGLKKTWSPEANPKNWGVLYRGTGVRPPRLRDGQSALYRVIQSKENDKELVPYDPARAQTLEGLILLDGNWSQAKTLWWRNSWLSRLQRLVLTPPQKSLYGKLRREPHRDCVSTLEAYAYAHQILDPQSELPDQLLAEMKKIVQALASS